MTNKVRIPEPVVFLMDTLAQHHVEARVAGGAVRDLLLGNKPKDFDLAVDAEPETVTEILTNHGIKVEPTGLQHGTVSAILKGTAYELTTLRIDEHTDGRHAEVKFTTDWKQDADRRDFTMNALFADRNGEVQDYVGGISDLTNGVLRFVGDPEDRIQEDYLRILRYFRFMSRYGLEPEPTTLRKIECHVDGLEQISGERIWTELTKIIKGPYVDRVFPLMQDYGVFAAINLRSLRGHHGLIARFTMNTENPVTVLLAASRDKDATLEVICRRFKASRDESKLGSFLLNNSTTELSVHDCKTMLTRTRPERRWWVHELIAMNLRADILDVIDQWEVPDFPLTGKDLIGAGIEPGPEFGNRLEQARKAWENSNFSMSKEALMRNI